MKKKALVLLSGGIDSTLATKLVLDQGIEVEAINFVSLFIPLSGPLEAKKVANKLGIKLRVVNFSKDLLETVKAPNYGYGENMNPCVDCRIYMLTKAKALLEKADASFLVTGEVLGERPMSQRKDMFNVAERDSGLKGLVLRPLSAKRLKPTIPETDGLVDRDKLLDITGRARTPQIKLAKEMGIHDYPNPSGGCLLTDPGFSFRLRDLFAHAPEASINDIHLLKIGRHFWLSDSTKFIVGRNEAENAKLVTFARPGDLLLDVCDFPSPITIIRGNINDEMIRTAASVAARYSKARNQSKVKVSYRQIPNGPEKTIVVPPMQAKEVDRLKKSNDPTPTYCEE